jgi:hypothetical protein
MHNPTFGTIQYDLDGIGAEWNSGEVVSVTIFDPDMNFDNRSEDEMKVYSNQTLVPAIKIGSPITLATLSQIVDEDAVQWDSSLNNQCTTDYSGSSTLAYESCYEKYSERSIVTVASNPAALAATATSLNFIHASDTTVNTLSDLIAGANGTAAYTYVQYDLRGLNGGSDDLSFTGNITFGDSSSGAGGIGDVLFYDCTKNTTTGGDAQCAGHGPSYHTGLVGNILINSPHHKLYGWGELTGSDPLEMKFKYVTVTALDKAVGDVLPISVDVVNWGQSNDGVNSSDRHNNAIYRVEVEEGAYTNDGGMFGA